MLSGLARIQVKVRHTDEMDDIIQFNKLRWEELSAAGVEYSEPWLSLTKEFARDRIDPERQLSTVKGKEVLCLAAGGGQQSVAFALSGAKVTVLDFSENQLSKDRLAASHYDLSIRTVQGDMRDLSQFRNGEFDIVWLAHSINFIPDTRPVIIQIGRICKPEGMLRLTFTNPFVHAISENYMNGGYLLTRRYDDGAEIIYRNPNWSFTGKDRKEHTVRGPREFRHRLSTIINGLIQAAFEIRGFWEETEAEENTEPGSWEHLKSIAPQYLAIWAQRKR